MITKRNESYKLAMLGRQVLKWLIKNQAHLVELLLKYVRNVVTVTVVGPVHSFFTVLENFITTIMDDESADDFADFGINNQFQYYYQASDPLFMSQDQNEQQQQHQQQQQQQSQPPPPPPPYQPSLPQQPNDELSKCYSSNGIKSLTNNLQSLAVAGARSASECSSSSSSLSLATTSSSSTVPIDLLDSSKLHELPKWHYSLNTFRERNANLLNSELMSDVRFIVGPSKQVVPAHKYVLATGSSVFYAMFYGTIAETGSEIEVPDVEPLAFLTMLRYLYCDDIQLEAEYVLATLYTAKKYLLPHLAKECVRFLKHNLTAKNACLLLCQSSLFEEPDLMEQCWDVIDAQAEIALKAEGFVDIDLKTLELIYSRESLNCKEMTLLEVALNWAEAECERRKLEPTPKNKREVLGKVLYLIRIPTMALDEFANQVAPLNIFTLEEVVDFFFHFTAIKKPCLTFSTKPRAGRKAQICNRFQSCAYRNNQWRYRGRCDSFQFMSDRRIFVIGFGLYGSSNGAADYKVKIELKRQGKCLAMKNSSFYSDGSSSTFHVFFEQPVQVDQDIFYTASAILDGNELSYFGQEGMTEIVIGPVTFQFQSSHESTNGTGVQGGQIPELIYYGP